MQSPLARGNDEHEGGNEEVQDAILHPGPHVSSTVFLFMIFARPGMQEYCLLTSNYNSFLVGIFFTGRPPW